MHGKERRAGMRRWCLAATLGAMMAMAPVAPAQDAGRIEGRVLHAESGEPLSDVILRISGTPRGGITDAEGRFQIRAVPPGNRELIAVRMGFAEWRDSVTVQIGRTATMEIRMSPAAAVIAPVVVSATREAQQRNESAIAVEVLDGAEVRRTRAAHPAGLMNRLAGVHVSELSGEGHSMAIRQAITTKPMYLFLEDGIP